MAYRIVATAVCLLWLVMTGLLVRSQVFPEREAAWLRVPIQRVVDHYFAQGEESDLTMYNARQNYGQITFVPRKLEQGGSEVLYSGSVRIYPGGGKPERVAFNGTLNLAPDYSLDSVLIRVLMPDAEGSEHEVTLSPVRDTYSYTAKSGGRTQTSMSGSIQELVHDPMLADFGIDLGGLSKMSQSFGPVEVKARMDELRVLNDTIPTYRISITYAPDLKATVHLSQTGRVIKVETPFGYTLLASGLEP